MILKKYRPFENIAKSANLKFMPINSQFTACFKDKHEVAQWRDSASNFNSNYCNLGLKIEVHILKQTFFNRITNTHFQKFVVKKVKI